MNDTTEIDFFKEAVISVASKRIEQIFRHPDYRASHNNDQAFGGEDVSTRARNAAEFFARGLHESIFRDVGMYSIEPFLMSFCSHGKDRSSIIEDGLLSQWRAYGRQSGVSIVFDYHNLLSLLRKESKAYLYHQFGVIDVVYGTDDKTIERGLGDFFQPFMAMVRRALTARPGELFRHDEMIAVFAEAACRIKHPAFEEEREVRIFAVPVEEWERLIIPSEWLNRPFPTIHTREGSGSRFIKFNEGGGEVTSCINRVIVGPSPRQTEIAAEVRKIVSSAVPVTLSRIPLI